MVGYFIAKLVAKIVQKVAEKAGLDKALHESDANQYVDRVLPGASPSAGIGKVVFWIIFVFVLTAAIGALKIPAVTAFMNQVLAYLPNVIAAIVIFVVAAAIAGAVAGGVAKLMGDTPTGKLVATAVPSLVMLIAVFMILNQLKIAPEIVTITYTALLFTVALASALAFGLGGRQVAADMLGTAYDKGREQRGQVKADLQKGKERGQEQAERGKEKAQAEVGNSGGRENATGARRARRVGGNHRQHTRARSKTMTHTESAVAEWRGRNAVDSDGEKIGSIDEIYMDAETGKPEWLAVKTGLFGSKVSFVPIAEASDAGGDVRLPYDKQQVKDAPNAEADGELSQEEEASLYSHYGLDYSEARSDSGLPEGQATAASRPTATRSVATPAARPPTTR